MAAPFVSTAASPDSLDFVVVVPARDAEETLPACLGAIVASRARPAAVVVVDDGSTDATAQEAEACGAVVLRPDKAPVGPGPARDLAASRTAEPGADFGPRSAVIALVDADVRVHPDALGLLIAELENDPRVVAAFGSYDDDPPAPGFASRYANLRHHFVHQNAGGEAVTFWAGLGVVRRDAWERVGGFGNRYDRPAIEDIDLGRRLVAAGGRIRCQPAAQATHLKAWSLRQLWRTDLFQRALPWSRLLLRRPPTASIASRESPETAPASKLNTGRADQASALAVHGLWLALLSGLLLHPAFLAVAAACVTGWLVLNARFLALLARRGGPKLLVGGGLLHAIYHAYASLAFGWVLVETRWETRGETRGERPEAGREVSWRLAIAALAIGLASATSVSLGLLAVAAMPTDALATNLGRLGGPLAGAAENPGAMQLRAALLAAVFLAAAGAATLLGPRPLHQAFKEAPHLAAVLLGPLRSPWVVAPLAALVALLGVRIGLHLDQTLRADEAQTFLRSGSGSPLFPMLAWTSPNNHILHSVLMRLSVMLFGTDPWAIRLPAAVLTTATVPLVFLGLRRHLGVTAALLAAGLFAGSGYAVEQGTNARGYPIVVAASLVLAALARSCAAGRPAALVSAAIAAAVGAWAVPVMLLPFAALLAYVAWWNRRRLRKGYLRLGPLAGLTGLFTLTLYAPAVLLVAPAETGVASAAADTMAEVTLARRVRIFGFDLAHAWEQMTFPAPAGLGALALAVCVGGALLAGWRGRRPRALVVAAALGPALVVVGLGVVPMPWWTLGFAFPVLVGMFAFAPAWILQRFVSRPARVAGPLAVLLGAAFAASVHQAGYPDRYPWRLGYPDARAAAATIKRLAEREGAPPLRLEPGPERGAVLTYHLREIGVAADSRGLVGGEPGRAEPWLLWIPPGPRVRPTDPALLAQFEETPVRRFAFEGSEALLLRPRGLPEPAPDDAPVPPTPPARTAPSRPVPLPRRPRRLRPGADRRRRALRRAQETRPRSAGS